MGTSWMFLYEAYAQVGVSIATLAYYCGPVIVMVLSPILFRKKMTSATLMFPRESGHEDNPISGLWYDPILGGT
jgi:hypothetical protein